MKSGPDAWGPHAWKFLHYVSLGYSDRPTKEDKEKYKSFFLLLQDVLPCSICTQACKNAIEKTGTNNKGSACPIRGISETANISSM
jgi:hypothetical protein